jgi:hypothetical protein
MAQPAPAAWVKSPRRRKQDGRPYRRPSSFGQPGDVHQRLLERLGRNLSRPPRCPLPPTIPSPFKITATPRCKYARRDAQTGEFGNLNLQGFMDSTKVVRVALQDAASLADLLVTAEAIVAELPKKKAPLAAPGAGAGMGDTDY